MIDSYDWGRVVIDGKGYASDVVISPSGVRDWWRESGHSLAPEDLPPLLSEDPEVLVIGTGAAGQVKLLPEAQQELQSRGIEVLAEPTDRAWQTYNRLSRSQRVVAALHLTC